MKNVKYVMIAITAVFICILLGIFVGRYTSDNYILLDAPATTNTNTPTTAAPNQSKGSVNINTADVAQLELLPGIGSVLAQRIVDYRTKHGQFSSVLDLCQVEGIGLKKLDDIMAYITVGG